MTSCSISDSAEVNEVERIRAQLRSVIMKLQERNSQSEPQGIFNENLRRSFDKLTATRSNQGNTAHQRKISQKPQVKLTRLQLNKEVGERGEI